MITTKRPRHQEIREQLHRQTDHLLAICLPIFLFSACCLGVLVVNFPVFAQQPNPYAEINRDAVTYNGPGRDPHHDMRGAEIRIGMLLPLSGPRQTIGAELQRVAQMAIEDENANSLSNDRLALVARDESGPWGQVSTQIASLIFDDQAVALITSADGASAHLAEQMANKIGVPILTLSGDSTTTEINLPWIFRLGPSDDLQAEVFAREIYAHRKLRSVLLICQNDHDGRVGGEAFTRAAAALDGIAPAQINIDSAMIPEELGRKNTAAAQAIVIWADAPTTRQLLAYLEGLNLNVPIYLCRKSVEDEPAGAGHGSSIGGKGRSGTWIVSSKGSGLSVDFSRRYRARFNVDPTLGAAETYDAVRALAESLRQSGPNRVRLRDRLAAASAYSGVSGVIGFDHAGNDQSPVALLRIK